MHALMDLRGSKGLEWKKEMIFMKYSYMKFSKIKLKEPDYKASMVLLVYSLSSQQGNAELF